jgi:pimeloyl-ACP methyl ester carboxylesterase
MSIKLNYTVKGLGDPLILIMGLGADGSLWEQHVEKYSRYFRCIIIDNRGAGNSPKPEGPYTTAMMAEDTLGVMDELNIDSAAAAGISMGSAIAQSMALLAPERIRSMVLISSWARCDRYMQDVFEHFVKIRRQVSAEDFTQLLQLWIFAPEYFNPNYADLAAGRHEPGANPMPDQVFAAQCAACSNHDTLDRLHEIKAPCLLTAGDQDIFTPLPCSQEMHERLANSEMAVFKGFGHCHHWEDLERFNKETTEFLLNN